MKGKLNWVSEDGTAETVDIELDENGKILTDAAKITAKGPTLGCLMGLHAWLNNKCLNCGKTR